MPDTEEPTRWGRMVARMHGEIPAEELEAYRRAGAEVYALLEDLEGRRLDSILGSGDAWAVAPATQAALVCGWNAFALQLLGDQLLSADYEADPPTVGYVPVVTARQALEFYGQVSGWLERARRAESNPSFVLDVAVPAPLPSWVEAEPCPLPHLGAIRAAAAQLRRQAMAGAAGFHLDLTDPDRRKAHGQVHELLANAEAALDYADRLWAPDAPAAVHEDVERHSKLAIRRLYLLGQLLAMPRLALRPLPAPTALAAPAAGTLPGQPGFDPWCLTDPTGRQWWQHDPQAGAALQALWAHDPQPARTLAIQVEIDLAVARGDIAIATWGAAPLGHYSSCPWAPIYEVRRPTSIAGRRLQPLQHFSYDVSADDVLRGGPFRRQIVVGPFHRNG
ncbi:MAG: hypothetical protein ABIY58_08890 [Acidimicrobiales bacterium]